MSVVNVSGSIASNLARVISNPKSVKLASDLLEGRKPAPKTLSDLPHEDIFSSVLSITAASKLGFAFGSVEGSFSRKVFIQDYAKYVEKSEEEGKVRWGVAIRWINDIKILDVQANLSSLPLISASAELGFLEASSKFQVIGMSSKKITELLPPTAELSVETYVKMNEALMAIKAEIWSDDTVILPTVLEIFGDVRDDEEEAYDSSVAASWALYQIWRGRNLSYAFENDPIKTQNSRSTIESVYVSVVGSNQKHTKPSEKAKAQAQRFIHGLKVT